VQEERGQSSPINWAGEATWADKGAIIELYKLLEEYRYPCGYPVEVGIRLSFITPHCLPTVLNIQVHLTWWIK